MISFPPFFGINISRDVFGANVIFWKVKFYFFWSRLSCGLNIKDNSWKIKVLSMQYRFEKLYDYSYKLLQFPREALRKKPSKFWENQKTEVLSKRFCIVKGVRKLLLPIGFRLFTCGVTGSENYRCRSDSEHNIHDSGFCMDFSKLLQPCCPFIQLGCGAKSTGNVDFP